jgi:hypothetical protein
MNLNWLYGPPLRSYALDTDTVLELVERARSAFPDMRVNLLVNHAGAEPYAISDDDMREISSGDRTRLSIVGRQYGDDKRHIQSIHVELGRDRLPSIQLTPENETVKTDLIRILSDSGRPLVRFPKLLPFTAAIPLVLMTAAWFWLQLTTVLPLAGITVGWIALFFAFSVTRTRYRHAKARHDHVALRHGHRIRNETRLEMYARRADSHRDLKVAALSAVLTLAVSIAGALLLNLL